MQNPAYSRKHWLIFVSVALMMGSSLGLLTNGNGVFYAPMARDLNVYLGAISLHTTFKSFASAFATLTIPQAINRLGFKPTLALGVTLATVGTFLMSFVTAPWMIYVLGVVRGIGTAYYSLVPMAMILNRWFDKHNGMVTGLASGTSGIIGAVSAPILTLAITQFSWRWAFILKAGINLLLALPVVLYPFSLDPEDDGLLPYGYEEHETGSVSLAGEQEEMPAGTFIIFALLIISFLNTLVMFINSHFPGFGESVGLSPETASLMLSGAMIGNLVWKAVYGILSDKIGPVKSALAMMGLNFFAMLLMISTNQAFLLIAGSFLFGGAFAISGVALPLLTNHYFGPVQGGKVYSRVSFFSSFGGAIGVGITGFIYDFTGSYIPAFIMALVFTTVNAVILIFAHRKSEESSQELSPERT